MKWSTKFGKGVIDILRIFGIWTHKEIEILGSSRFSVAGIGVAANDHISDVMPVECGQQIFEVLVHP